VGSGIGLGTEKRTFLAPTGFEARTVQSVKSRNTDYANPAPTRFYFFEIIYIFSETFLMFRV